MGFIEIYKEKVYDLLSDSRLVYVYQNGESDVKLSNKEVVVENGESIIEMLYQGNQQRKLKSTDKNEFCNRSHAIFRIVSYNGIT